MPLKGNSPKETYLELMRDGIKSPSRRKAIKTIMKDRNMSFEEAQKTQAKAIVRSKFDMKKDEVDKMIKDEIQSS